MTRLALGGTGAGGRGPSWNTCTLPPSTADAGVTGTEQAAPASATATTNARAILIKATPRSFVTAAIAVEQQPVPLVVPTSAIQTIGGEKVVFVRTPDGFEKRPVVVGRSDDRFTEIATGLRPGEIIAASNTFPLKAEFLKGQTED